MTKIATQCGVDRCKLNSKIVKEKMTHCEIPNEEEWRLALLQNLMRIRSNEWSLLNFKNEEIDELIHHVCTT